MLLSGTMLVLIIAFSVSQYTKNEQSVIDLESKGTPPMFWDFTPKSTFSDVLQNYEKASIQVTLPTYLPKDLKPTVAYSQNSDDYIGTTLFLYSKNVIEEVSIAELVIEVRSLGNLPFDPEVSPGTFIQLNGYEAYYNDKAAVGLEGYREKYGDTAILVSVQKGPVNYLFRAEPSISLDEVLKIAESITDP